MSTSIDTQIHKAEQHLASERAWVRDCGETLSGYIQNYGSKHDPDHYGDGGEAIFAADQAALKRAEARVADLKARRSVTRNGKTKAVVNVPLKIDVDLTAWAEAYGLDLSETRQDAKDHLVNVIRDAVAEALTRQGAGAALREVAS